MQKFIQMFIGTIIAIVILFLIITLLLWIFKNPSNEQSWEFGQQKLQKVDIKKNEITIKDIRNYNWKEKKVEAVYLDKKFKITDIIGLEVGQSHFSVHDHIAHIFLVFKVKDGKDFALSIEARRSDEEKFSIIGGLKFDFELIYLLATKKDLLSLREKRKEKVYIYPINATPEKSQELFLNLSKRINHLYKTPEFYHLFFKNCTNLITSEVEKISNLKFPFFEKTFTPGYSGEALHKMNLIKGANPKKPFKEIKQNYLIQFMN